MRAVEFRATFVVAFALLTFYGPICKAQAPPTLETELKKYSIPLTHRGLEAALTDSRPEVRGLAAGELAIMREEWAVAPLTAALREEKDSLTRFNMASALLKLGSEAGKTELESVCSDLLRPEDLRMIATQRLIDAGDLSCLPFLENLLHVQKDSGTKSSALLTLARIKTVPPPAWAGIHGALLASLRDGDPVVRVYAARAVASLGDETAAPDLQAAIAAEQDPSTREKMEMSLNALRPNP